jgi:phage/plasmid-like protein (TIGR03299 family)
MPADIAETNGKPMMAYQGATPWHSIGAKMAVTADVPTALKAANLDWNVELRPMFYRHTFDGVDKRVKVPTRRAVVRDTDGVLLATVGSDYAPFQNSEAFNVLQPACEQFGVTIETAGALGKGDRVWMLAKLPTPSEPIPGDKIDGYFLVLTGHNGWTSYTARPTPVRVVCANTLAMALNGSGKQAVINMRHTTTNAERFEQVTGLVTDLMAMLKQTNESFTKLAARKMTKDETIAYISEVLGIDANSNPVAERRRDTIVELSQTGKGVEFAPNTAWTAFNAVTEYVDHVRPAEAKAVRTIAAANQSALFGSNAKLKARALTIARRLAA